MWGGRGRERIFSLCLSQIIVMLQVNPPEGKRLVTDWKTIVLIVEPGKHLLRTSVRVVRICCIHALHMFILDQLLL